jgi:hypothetical protein
MDGRKEGREKGGRWVGKQENRRGKGRPVDSFFFSLLRRREVGSYWLRRRDEGMDERKEERGEDP